MSQNLIDGNGIQIETYADIVNGIVNGTSEVLGLVSIYGADINVASNTPDGNLVNIFALSKEDILQLCVSIYDSFDPDEAVGVALDNISQLCGIVREGGSYTETNVVVTCTAAVNLVGLDSSTTSPFTISDSNGNQFYLKSTISIGTAGTSSLAFRSAEVGYIQVIPNTITNIVTVTPGVSAVNNPSTPTLVGQDQETDAELRLRRQVSVSLPAQGTFYGLYAGLLAVSGLEQAVIYVNNTTGTDIKGVPAHSIWVITDGGASADIANVLYKYVSLGCGMKGTTTVNVTQIDASVFPVSYDVAVYQNLYISMHLTSKSVASIDSDAVKAYLASNYLLGIHEPADITAIDALIHAYSSDLVMTSAGVSLTAGSYGSSVWPTNYINKFLVSGSYITITT